MNAPGDQPCNLHKNITNSEFSQFDTVPLPLPSPTVPLVTIVYGTFFSTSASAEYCGGSNRPRDGPVEDHCFF